MKKKKLDLIKKKMEEKISVIRKWDYEYYILDSPSVEDSTYDKLLEELKELETSYNLVLPNSPTNKLNLNIEKNSPFELVERKIPMLSIDNVKNEKGLHKFDEKVRKTLNREPIEYVCELKIDGLSASLVYKKNELYQITTRGNGFIGEDLTFNKTLISDIPFKLEEASDFEVRGEIYMKNDEFLKANSKMLEKGTKKLSNPRNAAAGTLRTLSPSMNRKLNFFPYQYFSKEIKSQMDCLKKLKEKNFNVSEYRLCRNINEAFAYIKEVESRRDKINFSIDGIVVKVNSYQDQKILGENNKFPRWAIAYKFTSLNVNSVIKNISTEVSKNGKVSYVAEIKPVCLEGSLINKVTLHNFSFIKKNLINLNDKILLQKAGGVIPQVFQVIKKKNDFSHWIPPAECSSCSSMLTWNKNLLYQVCNNKECTEKNINYLTFFVSKSAINIKGISKMIIEKLYNCCLVRRPYEFYHLKYKKEHLKKIENFKSKKIENILNSIEKSRHQKLSNFVSAFSIPLLSFIKAKKLTSLFKEKSDLLLKFVKKGDFGDIEKELGIKTTSSIKSFFLNLENLENFEKAIKEMTFIND